jgi:hypothetical protein
MVWDFRPEFALLGVTGGVYAILSLAAHVPAVATGVIVRGGRRAAGNRPGPSSARERSARGTGDARTRAARNLVQIPLSGRCASALGPLGSGR